LRIKLIARNSDRIKELGKIWRLANPEKVRATNARRWARKASSPGNFKHDDLTAKLAAQNFKCAAPHCGIDVRDEYSIDHKIPLSRGGSNWPDNIQILCVRCNSSKRDRTMEEWLATPMARKRASLKESVTI
jgi:5-methylcytosine-specific restriction endonuclease McrA